jgi:hypothetical protein
MVGPGGGCRRLLCSGEKCVFYGGIEIARCNAVGECCTSKVAEVVVVVGMLVCSNAAALNDCAVHHRRPPGQASQPPVRDDPPDLKLGTVTQRVPWATSRAPLQPQPPRYVAHHSFSPGSLIVGRLGHRLVEQSTKSQAQSRFFSQDECDTSLQGYQRARLAVLLCFLLAFFA